MRPVRVTKRPKKKDKDRNLTVAKWLFTSRRIEMKSSMVGGLQMIVLIFEFHRNRLRGFEAAGVEICPSPLTWPLAYTTAYATVQAVISFNICYQ